MGIVGLFSVDDWKIPGLKQERVSRRGLRKLRGLRKADCQWDKVCAGRRRTPIHRFAKGPHFRGLTGCLCQNLQRGRLSRDGDVRNFVRPRNDLPFESCGSDYISTCNSQSLGCSKGSANGGSLLLCGSSPFGPRIVSPMSPG